MPSIDTQNCGLMLEVIEGKLKLKLMRSRRSVTERKKGVILKSIVKTTHITTIKK
jgi:hypothetical protein